MLEDLESGDDVLIDTSDRYARAAFADAAKRRRKTVRDVFRKLAIDHVVVRTDGSYVTPMRDLFARRARRARSGR
jgi:hypothetical protein